MSSERTNEWFEMQWTPFFKRGNLSCSTAQAQNGYACVVRRQSLVQIDNGHNLQGAARFRSAEALARLFIFAHNHSTTLPNKSFFFCQAKCIGLSRSLNITNPDYISFSLSQILFLLLLLRLFVIFYFFSCLFSFANHFVNYYFLVLCDLRGVSSFLFLFFFCVDLLDNFLLLQIIIIVRIFFL